MPYLLKDANFPIGGYTIRSKQIIQGLIEQGHHVGVLTWKGAKNYINFSTDFEIIESYDNIKGIKKLRWLYYRLPLLYKTIKEYRPDVLVQGCIGFVTFIYYFLGKLLKIPFVYMVANDMDVDNNYKNRINIREQIFYKIGMNKSNGIICQNEYQFNKLKEMFPQKKIIKINNPYIIKSVKKNDNQERYYIAWVGIFQKQKNMLGLFNIAVRNPDYKFKIAGIEGIIDLETKIAIKKLKSLDNVEFVGYLKRNDVLYFLKGAKVLLNTSYYEGLSNTFLEALSVGTPIFSINSNPNKMITKYNLGEIVRVDNFREKMLIYKNVNYYELLIRFHCYLNKEHNYKKIANKMMDFLLQIIENNR